MLLTNNLQRAIESLPAGRSGRMINSSSTGCILRLPGGRPRFPGRRVVRDAFVAGQLAIPPAISNPLRSLNAKTTGPVRDVDGADARWLRQRSDPAIIGHGARIVPARFRYVRP